MTAKYYIKSGTTYCSFDDICIREGAANTVTNFYDNNTNLTAIYRNIIATDNTELNNIMKHNNVNYKYYDNGTYIDISKYLLPAYREFNTNTISLNIVIPDWCNYIRGILIGSGGGGGYSNEGSNFGGGGGGGGYGYFNIECITVKNCNVTVTNGGGGANSSSSHIGGDGGDTVLTHDGIHYVAFGGTGGLANGNQGNGAGNNTGNGISGNGGSNSFGGGLSGFNRTDSGLSKIIYQGISNTYGNGGDGESSSTAQGSDGIKGYMRIYFCIN